MDKRHRILIVEDVKNMRDTWRAVFKHEDFRADGAATLEEAMRAIDRTSYHVALVDIMLAGEKDVSDRGGVSVLQYLSDLHEPTQCLVISGQDTDITLVRDLLKDFAVFDYIEKKNIEQQGNDIVNKKVKNAAGECSLTKPIGWSSLIRSLLADYSEDRKAAYVVEHNAVSRWLPILAFRGGFENFSNSLVAMCQNLAPLHAASAGDKILSFHEAPNVLSGMYWSKGQGTAVELLVFGNGSPRESVDKQWDLANRNILYDRTKADLSTIAVARPDLSRSDFVANAPAELR
jgi:CheY-like chemotaxis protein